MLASSSPPSIPTVTPGVRPPFPCPNGAAVSHHAAQPPRCFLVSSASKLGPNASAVIVYATSGLALPTTTSRLNSVQPSLPPCSTLITEPNSRDTTLV